MNRVLTVEKISKAFGGLAAVTGVSLHLDEGELVGLIGPNGAGKTTFFNLLTGIYSPDKGSIVLTRGGQEHALEKRRPHDICRLGVARTFQNIRLFRESSVLDNVRSAMNKHLQYHLFSALLHTPAFKREEAELTEKSLELLKIFHLENKAGELAKNLPYGEQRHLEIARALATQPSLLLLDEPAAGMNPAETAQLTETIHWIREHFGLTILLIEHDMSLVMKICQRMYVLDYGMLIAQGPPEAIKSDPKVIKAYLGEAVHA